MRGLGVLGRRLWSLGGALLGFLRLDLRAQLSVVQVFRVADVDI